jgi:tryptophanyl-tRNA synthetase
MVNEKCRKARIGCVECKKMMADFLIKALEPMYAKRQYYENKPNLVEDIFVSGSEKARKTAVETMAQVKSAVKIK